MLRAPRGHLLDKRPVDFFESVGAEAKRVGEVVRLGVNERYSPVVRAILESS